jgi:hypothetical protein
MNRDDAGALAATIFEAQPSSRFLGAELVAADIVAADIPRSDPSELPGRS